MPFEVPTAALNIAEHARNSVIRLNQRVEADVQAFVSDFEEFWGVSGSMQTDQETQQRVFVPAVGRYTVEQMQAKIDAMPQAVAMSLLMLAGLKRDMIVTAESALQESFLADRYKSPAFTMQQITSLSDPIVLTGIAAEWTPPEE